MYAHSRKTNAHIVTQFESTNINRYAGVYNLKIKPSF